MDKIKDLCKNKPFIMYVAVGLIVAGSALQVFFDFKVGIKSVLAIIVFLAFVVLGFCLMINDSTAEKTNKMSVAMLRARRRASKLTEDIMTIIYAAVVVLGTFCDSILVIVLGIVLFVVHTFLSAGSRKYFKKLYKDK